MPNNKFDFRTAENLIHAVEVASTRLEEQNGQMETRFSKLRDYFRDAGYEEFTGDMSAANQAIDSVLTDMHEVVIALQNYAEKLRENS